MIMSVVFLVEKSHSLILNVTFSTQALHSQEMNVTTFLTKHSNWLGNLLPYPSGFRRAGSD